LHCQESRLLAEVAECRQRLEERETSFKVQKRLLVKEVKALRQQVDKATAEKNLYRSQLQTLRDALLSAGGGGSLSGNSLVKS
jgi:chromosome segregation ATPase